MMGVIKQRSGKLLRNVNTRNVFVTNIIKKNVYRQPETDWRNSFSPENR